jgi:hypothetical protein
MTRGFSLTVFTLSFSALSFIMVPLACLAARRDGVVAAYLPVSSPTCEGVAMLRPPFPSQRVRALHVY